MGDRQDLVDRIQPQNAWHRRRYWLEATILV
jgi:hypothetical protein